MWLDSRETDRYLKVKFRPSSLLTYVSLLRLTVHVPTNTSDLRQLRPSSAELCVATQLIILKNIFRHSRINRKGKKFRTSATVQTTLYPVSIPNYMWGTLVLTGLVAAGKAFRAAPSYQRFLTLRSSLYCGASISASYIRQTTFETVIMPESTQNRPSATAPMGINPPSSSSPSQIPDLEAMRQRWDEKLEADFAKIKEMLREFLILCIVRHWTFSYVLFGQHAGRDRDAHSQQQSANDTHTQWHFTLSFLIRNYNRLWHGLLLQRVEVGVEPWLKGSPFV